MIRTLIALILLLFPSVAFSFELTQEHIQQAEMARADGVKIGLDKMTSEQLKEVTRDLVNDTEAANTELTVEVKRAFACYSQKLMDMQFRSEIKEFARYLNDKEYQKRINNQYEKECKVDELKN